MKKIFTFAILLLSGATLLYAQNKIDINGQRQLLEYKTQQYLNATDNQALIKTKAIDGQTPTLVLIDLNDDASIQELEEKGAVIVSQRGDLVMVQMPIASIEEFAKLQSVKSMSFGGELTTKLDSARIVTQFDQAHSGTGLSQAYNGTGVVVGLMDTGLDPNHYAFKHPDTKVSRVQRLWQFNSLGLSKTCDTATAISSFTSDDRTSTHGTHVLGIMAGAPLGSSIYYGLATHADIAISAGTLTNNNVLTGAEKIIEYAKSVEKPAVVNLSVGGNSGAHDGTSATNRYLAELGKDAIICISAGNEGMLPIALRKSFTSNDNNIKSFITSVSNGTYSGGTSFWSNDDTPFTFTAFIYDLTTNEIKYSLPEISSSTSGQYTSGVGSIKYGSSVDHSSEFDKAFSGYVRAASNVSTDNNRYYVDLVYELTTVSSNTGNLVLGFQITGSDGKSVYGYCDGYTTQFTSNNIEGFDAGTTNGTINDLVCGDNVFAIGAYSTRNSVMVNGGESYIPELDLYPKPAGDILKFSSYGTLSDGRNLPHVCAPGLLTSTFSTPYMQYTGAGYTTRYQSFNKAYYWGPMAGTSQASPFAAGTIALWLQAKPDMTFEEILDVIEATSLKDAYVTNSATPVQWGAGKIDPIAGLKYIIQKNAGVDDVTYDTNTPMLITTNGTNYEIYLAGADSFDVTIYNMAGQPVVSTTATDNRAVIDTDNLPKGIYIISAQGSNGRYTQRIAF